MQDFGLGPDWIALADKRGKMPIMRNPFRKQDENARPTTAGAERQANGETTKAIDIKEKQQPVEYKLSGESPAATSVNGMDHSTRPY